MGCGVCEDDDSACTGVNVIGLALMQRVRNEFRAMPALTHTPRSHLRQLNTSDAAPRCPALVAGLTQLAANHEPCVAAAIGGSRQGNTGFLVTWTARACPARARGGAPQTPGSPVRKARHSACLQSNGPSIKTTASSPALLPTARWEAASRSASGQGAAAPGRHSSWLQEQEGGIDFILASNPSAQGGQPENARRTGLSHSAPARSEGLRS
jgi:hypothetical protein